MEVKKRFVKEKFDRIVKNYDLVNLIGSFAQDKLWRKRVSEELKGCESPLLDVCCGPFTLSTEIVKKTNCKVWGLDFSFQMLHYGVKRRFRREIYPVCGDAEQLPFTDETFGGISIAFGFRNLPHRELALEEFFRVLKPKGKLVILEFSQPKNPLFRPIYFLYLSYYMPLLGGLLTGDKEAYNYLASSIKAFPSPEKVKEMLEKAGFKKVRYFPMTMGVVHLHIATKP